jgi:DNA-binding GntR family transcriptional regulator
MPQGNLNLEKLHPAPSLKEMALSIIKEAVLAKKLEPEKMYTEAALTNEMGISRTPVREALIHLASRGMIVYHPRKGFKIRCMTEKDVRYPPYHPQSDGGIPGGNRKGLGSIPEDGTNRRPD